MLSNNTEKSQRILAINDTEDNGRTHSLFGAHLLISI